MFSLTLLLSDGQVLITYHADCIGRARRAEDHDDLHETEPADGRRETRRPLSRRKCDGLIYFNIKETRYKTDKSQFLDRTRRALCIV